MRAGWGVALAAALAASAVLCLDAAAGQASPYPAHPWEYAGGEGGAGAGAAPYWRFLGGVGAGDSFAYRICDSLYGPFAAGGHGPLAPRSGDGEGRWACYLAELHIEAVVPVSGGRNGSAQAASAGADVYVVRAAADWGGGGSAAQPRVPESVLLVVDGGSGRLAVRHAMPADRALAESLQRTIFWRGGLGGGAALAYGEPVAELIRGVPSTALLVSGSRVSESGHVEYTAVHGLPRQAPHAEGGWRAHGGQGISKVVLAAGVGLPVSARVYGGSPPPLDHYHPGRPLFEYEMVALGQAPEPGAQPGRGAAPAADPISNPHYAVHGGGGHRPPPGRGDGGGW